MVLFFLDFCNVITITLESIVSWNNNNLHKVDSEIRDEYEILIYFFGCK